MIGTVSAKALEDVSTAQLTAGNKVKPQKIAPAPTGSAAPSAFEILMSRGEQAMKDAKYVDAQIAFQNALANKPDDPLALIALAHAELAAGAYAPAAYDLKFIFTRKPELVAVRYESGSFIPTARQEFLLGDLLREMTNRSSANMASFLYCYLCYQTGRTDELKAELEKWGERPGRDDWQAVLKRAWLPEQK